MRILKATLAIILLLVIVYLAGPRAKKPALDPSPKQSTLEIFELKSSIAAEEAGFDNLKAGNQSEIVFADSVRQTAYCILYLHGYSASPAEGEPLDRELAQRYGANLYKPRLAGHGLADPDAFLNLSPEELLESAKDAMAIAKVLGRKVIILASSTGGTLALYLARADIAIAGLILYSPNIDLYDSNSDLLLGPWGLQLARLMLGGKHREFEANQEVKKYWTNRYRIEGVITLKSLVNATMTDGVFQQITQPIFAGYYYKNETEQDKIISIKAIKHMLNEVSTPDSLISSVAFPNVNTHVIGSKYYSEDIASVREATILFLEAKMKLKPIKAD